MMDIPVSRARLPPSAIRVWGSGLPTVANPSHRAYGRARVGKPRNLSPRDRLPPPGASKTPPYAGSNPADHPFIPGFLPILTD